jgi:serine/threonine-protein kinase HipA
MDTRIVFAYSDWHADGAPRPMGRLMAQLVRRKEVFSFEFDRTWLSLHDGRSLDPDLQLFAGPQHSPVENFGLFMDSAPDRWGRMLMRRREAVCARKAARQARTLTELDYLLGVYDEARMGGIRFKTEAAGAFVSDDRAMAAPPWAKIRELEAAARHLDADEGTDVENEQWLAMLMAPGSSLGGARPKANVLDPSGHPWIAKFPGKSDDVDVGAWEMVVHELAGNCGIELPEASMEKLSAAGTTFMVKRFDRDRRRRIHFASAMTLLGRKDGDDGQAGVSYLHLAELLQRHGAQPAKDLRELWRRLVFSVAVKNTDDHLRNHGFLLAPDGWRLSPAYDLNPNPEGTGLSLNMSESDNSLDFGLARSVAAHFRLSAAAAEKIISQIVAQVRDWRTIAKKHGIGKRSQEEMAPAFTENGS